ncbi:hypothetical protein IQ07DRAFT_346921 [Pyrenochaeta sp. DS3sAY3a]|nr:hypothetical protein IQ07DRAFT_346921 [Pyrenochaeta sp. DS3sAY3a]
MKSDSREYNITPLSLAGILLCLPKLVLRLSNNVLDGDGSDQAIVPNLQLRNVRSQVRGSREQVVQGREPRRGGDGDLASVDRDSGGLVDGEGAFDFVVILEHGTEMNFKFSKLSETKYLCCQVSEASSIVAELELADVGELKVFLRVREGADHEEGVAKEELHLQATEELAVDERWNDKRSKGDGCLLKRGDVKLASLVKGRWEQPSKLLIDSAELVELDIMEIEAVDSATHLRLVRAQRLLEDLDEDLVRELAE